MSNKLIKSKKYQGIYLKHIPKTNDTMIYIAYKNSNGNYSRYKVGLKSSGITEAYAYNLRNEEINKIRLKENPKLSNKNQIIKFHEIAQDYFKNMELSQCSDYQNSYNKYKNHIKPVFGSLNIETITTEMIHEFKIKKLKTHAPATVVMHISFISSIYNFAIKNTKKYKGDNPAVGVESTIEFDNVRERFLTVEEIYLLLEAIDDYDHYLSPLLDRFVRVALSTGARASSILLIKRQDINISNRSIRLYDTKNKSFYNGYLSTKLLPDLSWLDDMKPYYYIFWNNRVLTHRIIQYHLRPIYKRLFNGGLEKSDIKNRVVTHTLRHTFASHLAINGVSLFEIQKLMNHKDIKMTLRYMKLAEQNKVSAVERIY